MSCRQTRGSSSVLRGVQSFHSHLALEVESAWSNRSLNHVPSWRVTLLNFNGTRSWYLRWQPVLDRMLQQVMEGTSFNKLSRNLF